MNNIKPNLILLHGWGFNRSIWQMNLARLNTEYNVYALDLNGHGEANYQSTFEDLNIYSEHLFEIISNFPLSSGRTHILGWSLGGLVALQLKARYPEQFAKIILCCTNPCFINTQTWCHGIDATIWQNFTDKLFNSTEKTIKEFLLLQTLNLKNSKETYKKLLDIINNSPLPSQNGLAWGLDVLKQDHRSLFSQINNKDIKFILGCKDTLVKTSLASLLNLKFPDIETELFEHSGHLPFLTESEKFYNALTYLKI